MTLRLGEGARGWQTREPPSAKPEGTWTYVHATTRDKVPVTEAASQKLPSWLHRGSNVKLICITGPPAHGLDKVIWNAASRGRRSGPNAKTVA